MRLKIIKKKVYTWDELSESQKQKALEKLYDLNTDYEWWKGVYDDVENVGIKLTGFDLDRHEHAEGDFLLSAREVATNIIRDHGLQCETFKTAQKFLDDLNNDPMPDDKDDDFSAWEDRMLELEGEFKRSILEDYSILLRKEYEYLSSEEAIVETIEANEYEFDENGNIA